MDNILDNVVFLVKSIKKRKVELGTHMEKSFYLTA